jgi:hypothetical protein
MYRIPLRKIVGWLAGPVGILALVLSSVGTATAQEEDMPGPRIHTQDNPPTGSTPNCVAVKWDPPVAIGEDIDGYLVTRVQPPPPDFKDVAENLSALMCGLQPGTTATFEVCAVYVSTEEDPVKGCSTADLSTTKAGVGELEPQPQPQGVPIVNMTLSDVGPTFIGVRWENYGSQYDYYNVNYTVEGGRVQTIKHDDDGDWGYQRIDGLLPGRNYTVNVQGCRTGLVTPLVGPKCYDWGPVVQFTTTLPYGPDTCKPGFVWRDAVPGDHICVTPERRQKVADDFHTAKSRRAPSEEFCIYVADPIACGRGQKPCLEGFVPRDVPGENVIVCVDQKEADLIAQENANPNANRVQPR